MDADEHALLATSLREVFTHDAADVPGLLDDLGWTEVAAADPVAATRLLFAEHGRALARTTLLDRLVLDALADALPRPATAMWWPAGDIGITLRALTADDTVAIPTGGSILVVPARDLTTTPVRTIDPDLRWCQVERPATAATGATAEAPHALEMAGAVAHRALAAELIALAEEILRLAVEHTTSRIQFGVPISAFQAVRHRLADGYVSITAANDLLDAAFADGGVIAAMAAKAQAGRAHQLMSSHALQVCGAMGSTYEYPLHRYVARGAALDSLLGRWDALSGELGHVLLKEKTPPRLVEV